MAPRGTHLQVGSHLEGPNTEAGPSPTTVGYSQDFLPVGETSLSRSSESRPLPSAHVPMNLDHHPSWVWPLRFLYVSDLTDHGIWLSRTDEDEQRPVPRNEQRQVLPPSWRTQRTGTWPRHCYHVEKSPRSVAQTTRTADWALLFFSLSRMAMRNNRTTLSATLLNSHTRSYPQVGCGPFTFSQRDQGLTPARPRALSQQDTLQ